MLKLALWTVLSAIAPQEATPPDWLGCWRATDGSGQVLLLEERRVGWLRDGEPSFHRLHARGDGTLRLERWARLTELRAERRPDGTLHVRGDGLDLALEPCEVPEALLVRPYAWPTGVEVDADTVATLAADLAARRAEDQRVRRDLDRSDTAQVAEMRRVDADNVAFLTGVVEELGWIDAVRFGSEASDAAFLIVQHCPDLRLMRTALPLVEADVRAGRLDGQLYALLFDRLQLNLGYLQRYGSQVGSSDEHGPVVLPCEDLARVDERRAELGLIPLADYLDVVKSATGGPTPVHLTDLLEGR